MQASRSFTSLRCKCEMMAGLCREPLQSWTGSLGSVQYLFLVVVTSHEHLSRTGLECHGELNQWNLIEKADVLQNHVWGASVVKSYKFIRHSR